MARTVQGPSARSQLAHAATLAVSPAALAQTVAALAPGATRAEGSAIATSVPSGSERFVSGELLGEGGMGRVLVADDRQFGRKVALEEMHPGPHHPDAARRFAVEALVTGNLEHPGIPAVYERGMRDGGPYYAMRRVEGRPLSEVIAGARTLKERLAILPVIVQVANTLGFAHERGVVHRDVKPANVLVAPHGEVVLLDWGIAKVRDLADSTGAPIAEGAAGATIAGSVLGTPAYMAPEQARGDIDAVDERTDVFALGAMLYHALSGRAPYEGPTSIATLALAIAIAARRGA